MDRLLIPGAVEFLYATYDYSCDIAKYSRQIWSVFLKKVKYFYITLVWRHSNMSPASPKGAGQVYVTNGVRNWRLAKWWHRSLSKRGSASIVLLTWNLSEKGTMWVHWVTSLVQIIRCDSVLRFFFQWFFSPSLSGSKEWSMIMIAVG